MPPSKTQSPPSPTLRNQAWLAVGVLWFVALLNYLDRMMITTLRDPIKQSIPMTDAQFGLLTAVFLWIYGAVSPLGGFLADRFSRRWVILWSLGVWSFITWLTSRVQTFEELLATRAVMGISEACYIPAALALISDYHRGPTRSLATGLHMSGIYTGAALGGVGGFMADLYGWRFGFAIFGAVGIGYAIVVSFLLRDAPPQRLEHSALHPSPPFRLASMLQALFRVPGFWLLMAVNVLFGMANWTLNAWLPTYLREHFHLSLGAAGMSACVYGLSRGAFDANHMPVLRQLIDGRYSATGYGILNFASCSAGGVMIYLGGLLKDANVDLANVFQIAAAALLAVGLLLRLSLSSRAQNS
ncbi:MAG: MFS transporter [Verrucomicrobia bacterium]|nr:MFS transporter [Verrucomicrobiota bacterium]